jgi:hypothetical protein
MNGYLYGDQIHIDCIYPNSVEPIGTYYRNVGSVYYPELPIRHVNFNEGDSDHTSFNNHGYMGIYPFEDYQNYSPYIHSVNDVIGTSVTSFEMSQQYCQMNIACLAEIANLAEDAVMELDSYVSVYPNPAEKQLNINAEGLQKILVFNAMGQLVQTVEVGGQNQITLEVGDYPTGLYTLQMVMANGVLSKTILVK